MRVHRSPNSNWWGWQGSNLRPRDYESPALTTELQPRSPASRPGRQARKGIGGGGDARTDRLGALESARAEPRTPIEPDYQMPGSSLQRTRLR
jgi:hypothetical protein